MFTSINSQQITSIVQSLPNSYAQTPTCKSKAIKQIKIAFETMHKPLNGYLEINPDASLWEMGKIPLPLGPGRTMIDGIKNIHQFCCKIHPVPFFNPQSLFRQIADCKDFNEFIEFLPAEITSVIKTAG